MAIVAGETEDAVDKALKRIKVKYRVEEPVLDMHKAKDGPILVHPEDNWEAKVPVGADNRRESVRFRGGGNPEMWIRSFQSAHILWTRHITQKRTSRR